MMLLLCAIAGKYRHLPTQPTIDVVKDEILFMHNCVVLQVCGVSAILTDPGPVCTGDTVVLTCTIPGGVQLIWRYNNEVIGDGVDTVGGVMFTQNLLDSSPDLVSQLSFTASTDVNGGIIQCVGDAATSTGGFESVSDDITVQVEQICKQ